MAVAGRRKQAKGLPQDEEAIYQVEEYLDQPALIVQSVHNTEEHLDHDHHSQ
jgi:hypothetical protein